MPIPNKRNGIGDQSVTRFSVVTNRDVIHKWITTVSQESACVYPAAILLLAACIWKPSVELGRRYSNIA